MDANDSTGSTLQEFSAFLFARCGLAATTIDGYVATMRRLAPALGERPEHKTIDQFITGMRRDGKASYSHIKNTSQAIERYMEFLGAPIKLGRPKKPKRILKGTLSEAEVTLLIAATRTTRDRAMLTLLAYSGIRNQELCSLRIEDLDVAGLAVRVNAGKGNKDRAACIAGACAETVLAYIRERNALPGEPLFLTIRRKRPFAPQDLRKLIRVTAGRAGIRKRVHPHLLRHSLATHMLARGSGLLAIKQQLGHEFIETTMIYLHAAPARMQAEYRFFAPSYL